MQIGVTGRGTEYLFQDIPHIRTKTLTPKNKTWSRFFPLPLWFWVSRGRKRFYFYNLGFRQGVFFIHPNLLALPCLFSFFANRPASHSKNAENLADSPKGRGRECSVGWKLFLAPPTSFRNFFLSSSYSSLLFSLPV